MSVVQVEMDMLAERADPAYDVKHVTRSASHRVLYVCRQIRQPAVLRAKVPKAQARMGAREPCRRLPDAEVADVDAATDSFNVLEPLRHLDEPRWLKSRGVLQEDHGAARPLAQTRIEIAHRAEQAVCLCRHRMLVMDDQAGDAAREAVGERPHQVPATLVK